MDWLRRNWPDLLIGVALVAVIAGIIATLISGGSFFPVRRGSTPTPQPTTPITGTTTPGTTTTTTPAGGTQPVDPVQGTDTATGTTVEGTGTDSATGAPVVGQDPATALPGGDGVAVLPPTSTPTTDTPTGTPVGTATGTDTSGGVTALPPSGTPAATTPAATTPPVTTPAATTPAATTPATPASASSQESSYRVSVGAFGNAENAQRLAQQVQDAGYPVLLGSQGSLTLVLVGPYATDAEARTVASQIGAGNFGVVDPTVYLYVPDGASTGATAAAPAATTPGATTPAPTTPAAPVATTPAAPAATPAAPATSATGRYLQVGAYANRESSLPQRTRLEGLGFSVTEVVEGDLLKLLVGPYQGQALTDAQSRLASDGIENFARGL